ncbi:MAG: hypothetical protein AB8H79_11090 [Myxococcota bacterium]
MKWVWFAIGTLGCASAETSLNELPPDGVQLQGCANPPLGVAGENTEVEVTVANFNDVNLRIETITFEGPFSAPTEPSPLELPAGFGTGVTLLFSPTAAGVFDGSATFNLNAPPYSLTCELQGEALP